MTLIACTLMILQIRVDKFSFYERGIIKVKYGLSEKILNKLKDVLDKYENYKFKIFGSYSNIWKRTKRRWV